MKIIGVEPGSIAEELGLQSGDEVLEINGNRVRDHLDVRFSEGDEALTLKIARNGEIVLYDIEKDESDRLGLTFEEMRILSCGNDCIFCFVDQNPKGLRNQLYFRDGDYRLSFMYGNYTTMTNAGPAILQRIVDQRLAPQYISVHATDPEVRRVLMGLKKDDHILEKIEFLHDHEIDMHTQIVLCPGFNDGDVLEKTVRDLSRFTRQIRSLAIVPVGLTDHRFGLARLQRVDASYARALLSKVRAWQKAFRMELGRSFVYASDEFYLVAGEPIPATRVYDGFPQLENGVGMVRSFLTAARSQARRIPPALSSPRKLTVVTGELASGFMTTDVLPLFSHVKRLSIDLVTAQNTLFGPAVTVAGLLSGKCVYSALEGREVGDLVLLPPDILNADGVFLDDMTVPALQSRLGTTKVKVFDGHWSHVFSSLNQMKRSA
ncbi:MAG: DUF512 domain-containing protein [Bacteroidota bacterium]